MRGAGGPEGPGGLWARKQALHTWLSFAWSLTLVLPSPTLPVPVPPGVLPLQARCGGFIKGQR